jgi:hypothetical protein
MDKTIRINGTEKIMNNNCLPYISLILKLVSSMGNDEE